MTPQVPEMHGARRAATTGLTVVLAIALLFAGSAEPSAEAGPGLNDAGAASPFAAQARRGQIAAPGPDDVEPMCALLTACEKLPIPAALFPSDFSACVKKMTEEMASPAAVKFSLTIRECGLRANSCASLRGCALRGVSPDACRGRGRQGVVGFCDVEGRALTCWHDEVLAVRDCARGDEQCIVVDGEATCTLGPCVSSASDGERPRCSGSGRHLLRCEHGKFASLDCAAFGLKCSIDGEGAAGCATSGPACSGTAKRCDGNVAIACFNGHEVRVDCGAAGLACGSPVPAGARATGPASPATTVGVCVAPPASTGACDPGERARCDGDRIRYCYEGRWRSYFCRALGFRQCSEEKGGVRCAS